MTREGPPPASTQSREQVRLRAGIHFALAGAYSGAAFGFGPGLSAELGATFVDRFSLSGRLTIGTIFIVSVATLGLAFDVALSDRVSVGIAAAGGVVGGTFVADLPKSLVLFAPLRVAFAPFPRAGERVGRRGLVLFAEVSPGYAFSIYGGFRGAPAQAFSPWSIEAALGIGYAWW